MKQLYVIACVCLFTVSAYSQKIAPKVHPTIILNEIQLDPQDSIISVESLSDGILVITQLSIIKISESNKLVWRVNPVRATLFCHTRLHDGTFLFGGRLKNFTKDDPDSSKRHNYFLLRLDQSGKKLMEKTWGISDQGILGGSIMAVTEAPDRKGYWVLISDTGADKRHHRAFCYLNSSGIEGTRIALAEQSDGYDWLTVLFSIQDGRLHLFESNTADGVDLHLLDLAKLTPTRNDTIGGLIVEKQGGGFYVFNYRNLVALDSKLKELWFIHYEDAFGVSDVKIDDKGNIIMVGWTDDQWVAQFNRDGIEQWRTHFMPVLAKDPFYEWNSHCPYLFFSKNEIGLVSRNEKCLQIVRLER